MQLSMLDTDVLSQLLQQRNAHVIAAAERYLFEHGRFALSAFTRYEIVRGLKHRNAQTQLARFAEFCTHSDVLPVSDAVLDRASELWAIGRKTGKPHRDADLLIAATAIQNHRALVTANTPHF